MAKLSPCAVEGCRNLAGFAGTAKGLCRSHYKRLMRYGDTAVDLRRQSYKGDLCVAGKCRRPARTNGLCSTHYAVDRRRKLNPAAQKIRNRRFQERYKKAQEDKMGRPRPLLCEMCNEPGIGRGNKPNAGICFDHDHVTGKPRGWLCDRCNKILGLARDDSDHLRKLAAYLEFHSGKTHVFTAQSASDELVRGTGEAEVSDRYDKQG